MELLLIALIIILVIILIFKKRTKNVKSNTQVAMFSSITEEKILYFCPDDNIQYKSSGDISLTNAYIINVPMQQQSEKCIMLAKNPDLLKNIVKINVADYIKINNNAINYTWQELKNNMKTDLTDAVLIIEILENVTTVV